MRSLSFIVLSLPTLPLAASTPAFDYVIVGGGTAGLTIANRLSELPDIQVAVIEAGSCVKNNPNVTSTEKFLQALGTPIDWQYESINQTYGGNRQIAYHAGKALGGTSTINGMTYVRAEKSQIDVWEQLGNEGWNWESLFPYYKKSESFTIPTAAELKAGASYVIADHGESGPLKTGYTYSLLNGTFFDGMRASWQKLGLPPNLDLNGGDVRGSAVWQSTVDMLANVREDAARAYYYPIESRPNLHVFLNTTVNRILWKEGQNNSSDVVATGVEVTAANGDVSAIQAKREVILSAGSIRSPAILELSGVGNPEILSQYDIPTVVDLPSVGENLQDQPNVVFDYKSNNTNFTGLTPYVTYASLADFMSNQPAPDLTALANTVSAATNVSSSILLHLFQLQYHMIGGLHVPDAEISFGTTLTIGLPASNELYCAHWLLMPFSRGSIHINSKDPLAYPTINTNFFLAGYDLEVQIAIAKFIRKFWTTQPANGLANEINPGFTIVPENASDAEWAAWIKSTYSANLHPLGTASMMSKELGGVVNSNLTVYGTSNVRVCDASVIPFQVSGHLTATIYAISERVSDLIKLTTC